MCDSQVLFEYFSKIEKLDSAKTDPENFVKKYWVVQKLDHLTCSKCLFMTLLYNMYKPINFHSNLFSELRYMSNGLTF